MDVPIPLAMYIGIIFSAIPAWRGEPFSYLTRNMTLDLYDWKAFYIEVSLAGRLCWTRFIVFTGRRSLERLLLIEVPYAVFQLCYQLIDCRKLNIVWLVLIDPLPSSGAGRRSYVSGLLLSFIEWKRLCLRGVAYSLIDSGEGYKCVVVLWEMNNGIAWHSSLSIVYFKEALTN